MLGAKAPNGLLVRPVRQPAGDNVVNLGLLLDNLPQLCGQLLLGRHPSR